MKKKISFIMLGAVIALTSLAKEKYNVLFIAVDDLRPELGCYGATHMKTPNIDKLASNARLFTNHYVQVPTCGASRPSMLTSKYPRCEMALKNEYAAKVLSKLPKTDSPETFFEQFRKNGYYTVGISKIGHSGTGYNGDGTLEFPNSWDERLMDSGKWQEASKSYYSGPYKGLSRKARYEMAPNGTAYPDTLNMRLAKTKLAELKERKQPFVLAVGFIRPHLPFNSEKKYWDLYSDEDVKLPIYKEYNKALGFGHDSGEFNTYKSVNKAKRAKPLPDAEILEARKAYYASVSYADDMIGEVLKELKNQGLDKNTIVVLWGDHGWLLGENAIWGKHTNYKRAVNSPLIISVPGMKDKGVKTTSVAESVDIYPTLCDLAGIEIPNTVDGKSLVPILENPNAKVKDFAVSFFSFGQISVHRENDAIMSRNITATKGKRVSYFNFIENPEQNAPTKNIEAVAELSDDLKTFLKEYKIPQPLPKK